MGGRHSGSNLHTDPLGTSAWNTLLLGQKLWALFPPSTPEECLKSIRTASVGQGRCPSDSSRSSSSDSSSSCSDSSSRSSGQEQRAEDFCAAGWFVHILPHLPVEVDRHKLLFVQEEGETVFVPAGWRHAVLNLTTTVCVTQNYASPYDYLRVAHDLYSGCAGGGCAGAEGEVADEWRLKVLGNCMWEDVLTHKTTKLNLALDFCVHCSQQSLGHVCELLDDRPVCVTCEASDTYKAEYTLLTDTEITVEFGLDLTGEEENDIPPWVVRHGARCFLRNHILQLMQEEEEEEEA